MERGEIVYYPGESTADPIQMIKHAGDCFAIKTSGTNRKFVPIDELMERIMRKDAELRKQAAQIRVEDEDADA